MSFAPALMTAWTGIPVRNLEAGMAFYGAVTGACLDVQEMGPNKTAVFRTDPPMQGGGSHLYEGTPAGDGSGPTIHLAALGTIEEAIARVEPAGGKVISPPIAIPDGKFAYITDPDGNSIGLFSLNGA